MFNIHRRRAAIKTLLLGTAVSLGHVFSCHTVAQKITIESAKNQKQPYIAQKMLDGNFSGESRWSAQGFNQTVTFDLGSVKTITGTKIWAYKNRAYQYFVRVSKSPNSGFVTVADNTQNKNNAQPLTTNFNKKGRYIKLVVTGAHNYTGDWVSLKEFRVLTQNATKANKPTAQASGASANNPASVTSKTRIVKKSQNNTKNQSNALIFLNENKLAATRAKIKAGNPRYVKAYADLIKQAKKQLKKPVDPVTNKTFIAASGDIHDYHTTGSYYWPDKTKPNGLPWVYRDGQFNRASNGPQTDWRRRKEMLNALEILNLAYYLSDDKAYLNKAKTIVQTWFVDPKTRMNPHLNYAKSIPGKVDGTNFGVIDFEKIAHILTTVQLIKKNTLWDNAKQQQMQRWLNEYYTWLTTSEFGVLESTRTNNHGTNYDYQALSLQLYLGKKRDALKQINTTKQRIRSQIDSDGAQPHELSRTKSVNYTVNNLWALSRIADLSRRHTQTDLWAYRAQNGKSIKKAFNFVVPYIEKPNTWQWKQISGGGVKASLANLAHPRLVVIEAMLDENILPKKLKSIDKLSALELLTYAP